MPVPATAVPCQGLSSLPLHALVERRGDPKKRKSPPTTTNRPAYLLQLHCSAAETLKLLLQPGDLARRRRFFLFTAASAVPVPAPATTTATASSGGRWRRCRRAARGQRRRLHRHLAGKTQQWARARGRWPEKAKAGTHGE